MERGLAIKEDRITVYDMTTHGVAQLEFISNALTYVIGEDEGYVAPTFLDDRATSGIVLTSSAHNAAQAFDVESRDLLWKCEGHGNLFRDS